MALVAVADLDARALGDLEPGAREPHALVLGADHRPRRPLDLVPHAHAAQRERGLQRDPLAGHPGDRLEGPSDQDLAQLGIGATLGDAEQVLPEALLGIRLDVGEEAGDAALGVGDERAQILARVEGEAEEAAAIVSVAAAELLGRLLEDEHAPGSLLPRGDGGGEGGVPRADHEDIVLRHAAPPAPCLVAHLHARPLLVEARHRGHVLVGQALRRRRLVDLAHRGGDQHGQAEAGGQPQRQRHVLLGQRDAEVRREVAREHIGHALEEVMRAAAAGGEDLEEAARIDAGLHAQHHGLRRDAILPMDMTLLTSLTTRPEPSGPTW